MYAGLHVNWEYFKMIFPMIDSRLPRDGGKPPECDAIPNLLAREQPWTVLPASIGTMGT
jgi:hypothetical protein